MNLFTDILTLINSYEEKLKDTHTIELLDKLPVNFSKLVWTFQDDDDQEQYGFSLLFTFSLNDKIKNKELYYTDVKVELVGEDIYEFAIHFGELEAGDIDIERITVRNESDYIRFLIELKGYIEHNYNVTISN